MLQENYGKIYMSTQIAVVMATHSDSSSPLCVTTQSPAQFANALSQGLVQDLVRRADRGDGERRGGGWERECRGERRKHQRRGTKRERGWRMLGVCTRNEGSAMLRLHATAVTNVLEAHPSPPAQGTVNGSDSLIKLLCYGLGLQRCM